MGIFDFLKEVLPIAKRAMRYARKRHPKKSGGGRTREKLSIGRRLTILAGLLFVAACLLATGIVGMKVAAMHSASTSSTASTAKTMNQYSNVLQNAQKELTLQAGAGSTLTRYPGDQTDALSSATVDQSTGNQRYTSFTGKGGVSESAASTPKLCPDAMPSSVTKYYSVDNDCNSNGQDFLTSTTDGTLFVIPEELTTGNPAVETVVNGVRVAAWLFLVPFIALIGIDLIMKGGNFSYADAIESLPRLILAVVGIACCLLLAQWFVDFGTAVCQGLWSLFESAVGNKASITDIVLPSSVWESWLTGFLILIITLMVAEALAPMAILGNDFGALIAVAIYAVVTGVLIAEIPNFVLLFLSMALGGIVIIRIIMINLYVILSPLMIVAAILPGKDGVAFAKDWITGFVNLILSQIAQVAVLGVGLILLTSPYLGGGMTENFIKYGTLALAIRVPSLFSSKATDLVKQVGPMVASGIQREHVPFLG